jgi:hypothetical protein
MELASELLRAYRSDMDDTVAPYLWSDVDIYGYADDAQKMFCRLTDGIADATTPSVTKVPFGVNQTSVKLHKSILKIRTATLESTGKPVGIINVEDMPGMGIRFDGTTGPLTTLVEGMESHTAFCYPVPTVADAVKLVVFRLPLKPITDGDVPLEIDEQHHRHLLLWMKSLGYLKQDSQAFDKAKSEDFEGRFRAYCVLAKAEQQKKRHKVRTVSYGGIQMGDTYTIGGNW